MKESIVKQLNELNKTFYKKVAHEFDISRQYAWPGWEKITNHLKSNKSSILDIGCGNGRFYKYLLAHGFTGDYVGIDSSKFLLNEAKIRFPSGNWQHEDIIKDGITTKCCFDLVVAFGVSHHIPGSQARINLLKDMASRCSRDGLVAVSFWQFTKSEKLENRTRPLSDIGIADDECTPNDYLLDWKHTQDETALRYCHLYDKAEIETLCEKAGLEILELFESDGGNKEMNLYLIARPKR